MLLYEPRNPLALTEVRPKDRAIARPSGFTTMRHFSGMTLRERLHALM